MVYISFLISQFLFSSVMCHRQLLLPKEIYPHKSDTKFSSTYFLTLTKRLLIVKNVCQSTSFS